MQKTKLKLTTKEQKEEENQLPCNKLNSSYKMLKIKQCLPRWHGVGSLEGDLVSSVMHDREGDKRQDLRLLGRD